MLSISPPRGGSDGRYYTSLANGEYYSRGGEPPGRWYGEAAQSLGLEGEVRENDFITVLQGYSPESGDALVRNAGAEGRRTAWDLTFSAPKSVSVLWAMSDIDIQREIQKAQGLSVEKALGYLDEFAVHTRRGQGGLEHIPGKMVAATFEHGTSRAGDPQLHTHAVVANVVIGEDGRTSTIESKYLFRHKMAAGAVYRAELAKELNQRLGVEIERKGREFSISGISDEVTSHFSKRRAEILKELEERGLSSAEAASIATLSTRGVKEHRPRSELFMEWQAIGQELGFGRVQAMELTGRERGLSELSREERLSIIDEAAGAITEKSAHFSYKELVRDSMILAQDKAIGADAVMASIGESITSGRIIELGHFLGERSFTTEKVLELERDMLLRVERLNREVNPHPVRETDIVKAFNERASISSEQVEAVRHLTEGAGHIQILRGMAGTGKSYVLGVAREVWESAGYEVLGASLAGKAAQGLEAGSGIRSDTLHKRLWDINHGNIELNSRTVIVIDEAGMVGTHQMAELIRHVERSGARLSLVGDERQLQPVASGAPMKAISRKIGFKELNDIRRQEQDWAKEAVRAFSRGDAEEGLYQYAKRGLLRIEETQEGAKEHMISDWSEKGVRSPESHVMIAGMRHEVKELNEQAQVARLEAGEVEPEKVRANGYDFHIGDRVMLRKANRMLDIKNGSLGTVQSVDERKKHIKLSLDGGRRVTLSLHDYKEIELGYAMTGHKSQGETIDHVYVLAGGHMQDREASYVQASRSRKQTIWYSDRELAGPENTKLVKEMERSRQKHLALEIAEKGRTRKREQDRGIEIGF